jgi:hypothetical protein
MDRPSVCGKAAGSRILYSLVVSYADPNADQIAFTLSFRNDLIRAFGGIRRIVERKCH